jgi:hypothetical protein
MRPTAQKKRLKMYIKRGFWDHQGEQSALRCIKESKQRLERREKAVSLLNKLLTHCTDGEEQELLLEMLEVAKRRVSDIKYMIKFRSDELKKEKALYELLHKRNN